MQGIAQHFNKKYNRWMCSFSLFNYMLLCFCRAAVFLVEKEGKPSYTIFNLLELADLESAADYRTGIGNIEFRRIIHFKLHRDSVHL